MKAKVNIRDHLREAADSDNMLTIEASVDVDNLFETAHIPDECEVDLFELLAESHAIALVWDAEQVRSHYGHLSEEQAWEVLQQCERRYSAEQGLCWDDIAGAVAELYPEPEDVRRERVDRCQKALEAYTDFDARTSLIDLLSDARHWCDRHEENFSELNHKAHEHYLAERNDRQGGNS